MNSELFSYPFSALSLVATPLALELIMWSWIPRSSFYYTRAWALFPTGRMIHDVWSKFSLWPVAPTWSGACQLLCSPHSVSSSPFVCSPVGLFSVLGTCRVLWYLPVLPQGIAPSLPSLTHSLSLTTTGGSDVNIHFYFFLAFYFEIISASHKSFKKP